MGQIENSKALAYVKSKGWNYRTNDTQLNLEVCPVEGCDGFHFYMSYTPDKDGVWSCFKCASNGNLYQLREVLGDKLDNTMSLKDVANGSKQPGQLPDVEAAHRRLMLEGEDESVDEPALDYLINERGLTLETIQRFKLGIADQYGKKWVVIPYLQNGSLVYAKSRTLPPFEKDFMGVQGREAPLFNLDVIQRDMDELSIVEGEFDCIACVSNGLEAVVGVPGANVKKTLWIKLIDNAAPRKIFLVYDNDKTGQDAAREMAAKIGIDKCYNVVLPKELNGQPVKDPTDFFKAGGTKEDLRALMEQARPFDVEGVYNAPEVLEELRSDFVNGITRAQYQGKFPELNELTGGYADGDLVGIIAEGKVGKTTFALNELDHLIKTYGRAGLMFCQEMSPKHLLRKLVAYYTDTPDDKLTVASIDAALAKVADYPADFLFGYTKTTKFAEVADTIRQAVRRYGVKFVCFDNLQMLCRNVEHGAQETSILTKQFKALAMELKIVILLIVQPHRVREGEIVAARNSAGSSAIEKDVDTMICAHRNRVGKVKAEDFQASGFLDIKENFEPQLLMRVDLSRFASGGATTLWMDGSRSKVTSFPKDAIAALAAMQPTAHAAPAVQEELVEA